MTPEGSSVLVRFLGKLNEDVDLGPTLNTLLSQPFEEIRFDLIGVESINSCGVRDWLLFTQRLQVSHRIRFMLVPQAFVEQAGVVADMLGKAGTPVEAFEAPYYCPTCRQARPQLLPVAPLLALGQAALKAPSFACERCKNPLDFDADEDEYFYFLRNQTVR